MGAQCAAPAAFAVSAGTRSVAIRPISALGRTADTARASRLTGAAGGWPIVEATLFRKTAMNVQKAMKQTSKTEAEAGNQPGGAQADAETDGKKPESGTQPVPSTAPADPQIAKRGA